MARGDGARARIFRILHSTAVKRALSRVPLLRRVYGGATWRHPFDRRYGTDTSGFVAADALDAGPELARLAVFYVGSQPSILRRVLATIPGKESRAFVDLGCGKGRPLVVASEFSFREIIGIDISAPIVEAARRNAAIVSRTYPARTPITLVHGNAFRYMPAAAEIVFFLYHPFGREGVEEFAAALEQKIAAGGHVFVIYYNPVWAAVLDAMASLRRWSAATFPYDPSELGFGADTDDVVVVWQSVPARYDALPGADRRVAVDHAAPRAWLEG